MYSIQKVENWVDRHHLKWIDLLRIILGIVLMIKGITLVMNKEQVFLLMEKSNIDVFSFLLSSQYVIAFYIAGGLLIATGLLTRVVSLLEIPIILGTIIFINYHQGLFAINSDLGYLLMILFLLIFFLVYGSGPISIDYLLSKQKEE